MTMASSRFAIALCLLFGRICTLICAAPAEDASENFKTFSSNLLMESDLDEFSIEKGAAISSPFGVGYMLANIHDQVWNVSNDGFEKVLRSPKEKISQEYASLIEKLNKSKMSTKSVLYIRDRNSTVELPEGSQSLKTEVTFADFISDWKTSWFAMNDMIANNTAGTLSDQLVPKGGWWGGAFYPFTMSAYINTNHYKTAWQKNWTSIGERKFWDGLSIPFFQVEEKFQMKETHNFTAFAVKLADQGKYAVFVLPKGKLVQFIRGDLAALLQDMDPGSWPVSQTNRTIQVPALNITLLDQHYKKLETLGINNTFCLSDIDEDTTSREVSDSAGTGPRGPFFASPIVQAHHIEIGLDFIEVSTATGSSINSEEKLKGDQTPDYDYGPAPSQDQGPVDAPLAQLTLTGSGEDGNAEVVVPVVLDDSLAVSLAEGRMKINGVDLTIEDPKTNETITAQSSNLDDVLPTSDEIPATSISSLGNSTVETTSPSADQAESRSDDLPVILMDNPVTPSDELAKKGIVQFNQPFFWYLYDGQIGTALYYGTVNSLATYKKEYGLETDEDHWLFDAYKTLLFNCP